MICFRSGCRHGFRLPDEILDEFHKRIDHGIFGYTDPLDEYFAAMNHWFSTRYGYTIEPDWVTLGAGIVYALGTSVRAFTEKGDAMMVMQPVYYRSAKSSRMTEEDW